MEAPAGRFSLADFHARFPDGASIAPGEYQTVALAGSDDFFAEYGIDAVMGPMSDHLEVALKDAGAYSPLDWYAMYPAMYVGDPGYADAAKGHLLREAGYGRRGERYGPGENDVVGRDLEHHADKYHPMPGKSFIV